MARKAAMPYPISPALPPPSDVSRQQPQLHVDPAGVPPIPSTAPRSQAASEFQEMGNPWADDYSARSETNHDIPDLLKPGHTQTQAAAARNNLQSLPDVLRPGWSGEATPRSSLDSDRSPEREWWDDDDQGEQKKKKEQTPQQTTGLHVVNDTAPVSPSGPIKRKPLPQSHSPQQPPAQNAELFSNNPFRRPSETHLPAPMDLPEWGSEPREKRREDHPNPLRSHPSTDKLGQLSLNDSENVKQAFVEAPSVPPPPPPQQAPPPVPQLQAPIVPVITATAPLRHFGPQQDEQLDPWAPASQNRILLPPSPSSFGPSKQYTTISTDNLLDRGQQDGSISLRNELKALPNAASTAQPSMSEVSLLEDEPGPPLPARLVRQESEDMYAPAPNSVMHQPPPTKPPRPAVVTSEQDLARMREQRNETYAIKHFNWFDPRSSRMRRSSMLTQNKNGPCPLLALVNALILGATEDMQAALDDALRLREQVTLGLIIETLMDELLSRALMTEGLVVPDVDELNRFLMRLRTGMNANPRFVPHRAPAPNLMDSDSPVTQMTAHQPQHGAGTFEATQDIQLYSSFTVKLIHGWLPRPNDQAAQAFARSAQTYEDAQAIQFGEEELEYKLSIGGLTSHDQQVWEDITSIKQFFQAYPTQLTPYGLSAVHAALEPGEFAILFRNDHFSTIYKNPHDQRLYTLITDAGYADRDEVIWETLEDINGARSEFFAGDFSPVSHGDSRHAMPHSQTAAANPGRSSGQLAVNDNLAGGPAMTPQEQEQHDADFAMALQLQEEEEQEMRRRRGQQGQSGPEGRGGGGGGGGQRPQQGRRSQGNIPIPLRGNRNPDAVENRPLIPPRNAQSRVQGVNRPADANVDDAPPAYEEAARTTPYVPPIGSPLHPSSSTDLSGRGGPSTSTTSVHAQGQTTGVTADRPGMGRMPGQFQHRRRTSAYGENSEHWQNHSPDYSANTFGPSYAFMRSPDAERRVSGRGAPDRDRDCVVM
ncbi:hypothetical protein H2198_005643 [Neophaeococcomyces mojaviensis]|uniref:Uncharacterized protein n=1 Tax=Neophaeococcomyces mojaviensis TaxID=3383035 RepID=A0ACC3A5J1_9EURO|nr:hypothetical protein H2198_005643 [Knufia sp. JES_112]